VAPWPWPGERAGSYAAFVVTYTRVPSPWHAKGMAERLPHLLDTAQHFRQTVPELAGGGRALALAMTSGLWLAPALPAGSMQGSGLVSPAGPLPSPAAAQSNGYSDFMPDSV